MRAWTVRDTASGALWLSLIQPYRRGVERALCPDYLGLECTWPSEYRALFEADLAACLQDDGLEIVEIEITVCSRDGE